MRTHEGTATLEGFSWKRSSWSAERGGELLGVVGLATLRYGLAFLLLAWGAAKFTAAEAEAIRPLVAHSPFLAWLYPLLGVRGASDLLGVFEVAAALLIVSRRWQPRASAIGSLLASGMFVVTLSFLFTTPDVFAPSSPWGGFLMKDLILLGAALFTSSEALRRAGRRDA
jgi:reactive chlorine resistance protein C